jgi:hypothetical protein
MARDRDIDYAAVAVKNAIVDKFGRKNELQDLTVVAQDKTILVRDGVKLGEGTRDDLLAALRKSETYEALWTELAAAN